MAVFFLSFFLFYLLFKEVIGGVLCDVTSCEYFLFLRFL